MMALAVAVIVTACSVSYKFNGASIDYTKIKTIQIADFPIRSAYVWGPMGRISLQVIPVWHWCVVMVI